MQEALHFGVVLPRLASWPALDLHQYFNGVPPMQRDFNVRISVECSAPRNLSQAFSPIRYGSRLLEACSNIFVDLWEFLHHSSIPGPIGKPCSHCNRFRTLITCSTSLCPLHMPLGGSQRGPASLLDLAQKHQLLGIQWRDDGQLGLVQSTNVA